MTESKTMKIIFDSEQEREKLRKLRPILFIFGVVLVGFWVLKLLLQFYLLH